MTVTATTKRGIRRVNHGRNHTYRLDGAKVQGVTTLIGKGLPAPSLTYWAARTVAEHVADSTPEHLDEMRKLGRDGLVNALKGIPWNQRDAAAAQGTEVHTYAEKLVKGEEVDVPDRLTGYVESCAKFMDDWRVAPLLTEVVVASRQWQYAGTLDLVADVPDGRRAILDYKTAKSGIFPKTALQLAAYRYADAYVGDDGTEMPMAEVGIDCGYAVWVRADGYDVLPVKCDQEVFKLFLHVATVARHLDVMKGWIGEPEHWTAPQ